MALHLARRLGPSRLAPLLAPLSLGFADFAPSAAIGPAPPLDGVVGELVNCPKYFLKEELLHIFSGCGLTPDRAFTVVDDKCRVMNWRLEFERMEDFRRAQQILSNRVRVGPRVVKLNQLTPNQARTLTDPVNSIVRRFRDTSLLMIGCPDEMRVESIERYFHGYQLAPEGVWHFWVAAGQPGVPYTKTRPTQAMEYWTESPRLPNPKERRTVVKFVSRAEVLRAFRERQGGFLLENSIQLRLIQ